MSANYLHPIRESGSNLLLESLGLVLNAMFYMLVHGTQETSTYERQSVLGNNSMFEKLCGHLITVIPKCDKRFRLHGF